jgi:hypothetical protein
VNVPFEIAIGPRAVLATSLATSLAASLLMSEPVPRTSLRQRFCRLFDALFRALEGCVALENYRFYETPPALPANRDLRLDVVEG